MSVCLPLSTAIRILIGSINLLDTPCWSLQFACPNLMVLSYMFWPEHVGLKSQERDKVSLDLKIRRFFGSQV